MNTTKLWFGCLILFFLASILLAPFWLESIKNMRFSITGFTTYSPSQHQSCYINIIEPTIILRLDDVRAYSVPSPYLINEIINRNLSITLGVIPRALEKDSKMQKYLLEIKANPNIEIAQHGTEHNESDENISEEKLLEGNIKIQNLLKVKPVTYIPPHNKITEEARNIVSKYFRIISAKENILKEGKDITEIGYTTATYYYSTNKSVSIEKIISKCKENLDKTNLCVVMIHPQEYSTNINNPIDLSEEKFQEFKGMLDKLQELNATFSTFKNLVVCYDEKKN